MGDTPFQIFISLVALDQQINQLARDTVTCQAAITKVIAQREQLDRELQQAKQQVNQLQKIVDSHELEMKALDDQEQTRKKQLEQAHSQKEYVAIKSEIDLLKKKQHELEETLINVWNDLENAQKTYAHKESAHAKTMTESTQELAQLEEKKNSLHAQQEKIAAERQPLQDKVPEEWLKKYAYMRSKVSDPVVPVINGSCSSCHLQVSEQDMIELNHRKLVQCKDCFRLLYLSQLLESR